MDFKKKKRILGLNIKAERNRVDMKQSELAEAIDMSDTSISLIESGNQVPSALVLYDMAKVFGIGVDELFKGLD